MGTIISLLTFENNHSDNFQIVQPYSSTNIATAGKKSHFILSERSGFCMINNLSKAVHVLPML